MTSERPIRHTQKEQGIAYETDVVDCGTGEGRVAVSPAIADRWRSAVRPGVDGHLRDILWPASFPNAPRARVYAHALAALVVVTAVCATFSGFYWADDPQVSKYRAGLRGVALAMAVPALGMAVPLLLMCVLLAGALRTWPRAPHRALPAVAWTAMLATFLWWSDGHGKMGVAVLLVLTCALLAWILLAGRVQYPVLAAVAWMSSALMTLLVLLFTSLRNDGDYCTANEAVHPVSANVVLLCVLAALAAGSLAGWIAWLLSRRRARPLALYAIWLATIAATVVLTLAPPLHAAQTCGPSGIG